MKKLKFVTYTTSMHTGTPSVIEFNWGYVACGLGLKSRYNIDFIVKFRNKGHMFRISLDKIIEDERAEDYTERQSY